MIKKEPKFYFALILVLLAWPIQFVVAQQADGPLDARVDEIFAGFDSSDSPGAAVLVVREGKVLYRKGFGQANLEHGLPITPSTVFDIASLSKQFNGMAISMLVEQGLIDQQDDIRTYLPDLPSFESTITIDHLVHHTSGIRDWPGTLAVAGWRMDDVISFDQILTMARNQEDLNFEPGAEYSYSNTGYNILAATVAEVSGQSYREWTDENIFQPLGMRETHFQNDHSKIVTNRALGYMPTSDGYQNNHNGLTALGSSSLHTTIDDLAKWVMNFDDGAVGGMSVIERMQQRGVLNNDELIGYAFGQSESEYRGLELWSHTGSWAGYRTVLLRFPEQRFDVVVLSNLGSYNPSLAAHDVVDLYLGDLLEPSIEDDTTPAPEEPSPPAPEVGDLRNYEGEYYSEELATSYWVRLRDESLVAHHRRHGDIELTPVGNDEFRSDVWFMGSVEFDRDGKGRVSGLRVSQPRSRNMRFARRGME